MKNILLFFLFCTSVVNAQIVNIPDANFKAQLLGSNTDNEIAYANGTFLKIDANSDGEIQETEAAAVDSLNIFSAQIADLSGLGNFVNLKKLNCAGNQISAVDLSNLSLLKFLDISNNQLAALDISSLSSLVKVNASANLITNFTAGSNNNLKRLDLGGNALSTVNLNGMNQLVELKINANQLASIDLSALNELQVLYVNNNSLTSLNISNMLGLLLLDCSYNNIDAIDFSGLNALQYLAYSANNLQTLDVSSLTGLQTLICSANQLTSIDLSALSGLLYFEGSFNNFSALDLSANLGLGNIICDHNQLSSIDVSMLPNLTRLNVDHNQLTQINLAQNTMLFDLVCSFNQLTTLNVNANTNLFYIDASDNTLLTTIFMNNGTFNQGNPPGYLGVTNCTNLEYVCVQEEGIGFVKNQIEFTSGATDVVVNSYCSFSPSGDYNLIKGKITYDADANGCDASDLIFPNLRVNITDGANSGANFIDAQGNYSFVTQQGSYTVTPSIQHPEWFAFSPNQAVINFADNNNNQQTADFCLSALGVHPDISVVLAPATYAVPGDTASYQIVYTNNGNQTLSGSVDFNFNDAVLDLLFSSEAPAVVQTGTLTWNYSNLQPFESRRIDLAFRLNATSETPAVNIGDVLSFSSTILPVSGDEMPEDNSFSFNQTVVDAQLLNNIVCLEGTILDPSYIGEYLHYIINFENIGTLAAQNAVIRFDVDTAVFDISSLQLLDASNTVTTRVNGNVVEFIFQNINLEIGGHGHILLKMRTLDNLPQSTVVANRANIFYDLNAPVDTGTVNTVFQSLSNADFDLDDSTAISPNPATNFISLKANSLIKSIEVYDAQGRIVLKQLVEDQESKYDVSHLTAGIYMVKTTTQSGISVQKLIKN